MVGSLRRGAIDPPEELDDQAQAAALSHWRQDASQDVRVHWERGFVLRMLGGAADGAAPKRQLPSGEDRARVRRMMRLACGKRGVA